jgi:hypothetical protein
LINVIPAMLICTSSCIISECIHACSCVWNEVVHGPFFQVCIGSFIISFIIHWFDCSLFIKMHCVLRIITCIFNHIVQHSCCIWDHLNVLIVMYVCRWCCGNYSLLLKAQFMYSIHTVDRQIGPFLHITLW